MYATVTGNTGERGKDVIDLQKLPVGVYILKK